MQDAIGNREKRAVQSDFAARFFFLDAREGPQIFQADADGGLFHRAFGIAPYAAVACKHFLACAIKH